MTFVPSPLTPQRSPLNKLLGAASARLLAYLVFSCALHAQVLPPMLEPEQATTEGSSDEKYDRMTRVSAAEAIAPLGDNIFGDSTNYYNGSTTFSVTDIDLPGNSALPVRVTRTHSATESRGKLATGLMGEWELELPHIHGTFTHQFGWRVGGPSPFARCSAAPSDLNPPPATTTVDGAPSAYQFAGEDYWNGNSLSIPGVGDQTMLVRTAENTLIPTDGQSYPWTTLNHWQLRCLPALANSALGEGFFALGTDGSKYTFNWMTSRPKDILQRSKFFRGSGTGTAGLTVNYQLLRDEYRIYATRVEDRFGNSGGQ